MLKPELARQQLEKLKSKQHAEGRQTRLHKLPQTLAAAGFGIFGKLADGTYPKHYGDRAKLQQAGTALLADDAKGRARVFAAFVPTLQAELEAGWQLLARLPYTMGYNRRAFRLPGRPA